MGHHPWAIINQRIRNAGSELVAALKEASDRLHAEEAEVLHWFEVSREHPPGQCPVPQPLQEETIAPEDQPDIRLLRRLHKVVPAAVTWPRWDTDAAQVLFNMVQRKPAPQAPEGGALSGEDDELLQRVSREPDRRVYTVDVGGMTDEQRGEAIKALASVSRRIRGRHAARIIHAALTAGQTVPPAPEWVRPREWEILVAAVRETMRLGAVASKKD